MKSESIFPDSELKRLQSYCEKPFSLSDESYPPFNIQALVARLLAAEAVVNCHAYWSEDRKELYFLWRKAAGK